MFIALKSMANGKYVCAENAGRSFLIANRDQANQWETFEKVTLGGDLIALRSLANWKYVAVMQPAPFPFHPSIPPQLFACTDTQQPFQVVPLGVDKYALRCTVNNKFVCAENQGEQPLIANRDAALSWETFEEVDRSQYYTQYYTKPSLVIANICFDTLDDNRDHDTSVNVYVKGKATGKLLAWIENAACSNAGDEFKDHSQHCLDLLVNAGTPKSDCQDLEVTVRATAHGNDTWVFKAKVTLLFSDSTSTWKDSKYARKVDSKHSNDAKIDFDDPSQWNLAVEGRFLAFASHQPVAHARVTAYDADFLGDDELGHSDTDSDGRFLITYKNELLCKDEAPDLYFIVSRNDKEIGHTNVDWPNVLVETLHIGDVILIPPVANVQEGILGVNLTQKPGNEWLYTGQSVDPTGKDQARIVNVVHNYPHDISLAHKDNYGNETGFILVPKGNVGAGGWNHEVAGTWSAQPSGPATSLTTDIGLEVKWKV